MEKRDEIKREVKEKSIFGNKNARVNHVLPNILISLLITIFLAFIVISIDDTTNPGITFGSGTSENGINTNSLIINLTTSDNNAEHYSFVDFDSSLVGWWRFNNETGENETFVRDWSSYGNNGTVNGGASYTTNSFLNFDGVNDKVNAYNVGSFGYNNGNANVKTITFWANGSGYALSNSRDANSFGYGILYIYANGSVNYNLGSAANSYYGYNLYSNATADITGWNFYSFSVSFPSGTGAGLVLNASMSINGVFENYSLTYASTDMITFENISIGHWHNFNYNNWWFNGSIDEVRIYNRTLSQEEITSLYNNGRTANVNAVDNTALLAYYPMSEATGTTTADASGNAHSGTITGATWNSQSALGKWGRAMTFDGVDDYVSVGNPSNLQLNNLTISLWYNQKLDSGSYSNIIGHGTGGWAFGISDEGGNVGKVFFAKAGLAPYVHSQTVLNNNQWYFLTITVNGANSTLYVNNVPESSNLNTPAFTFANEFRIGQDPNAGAGGFINGSIDDVLIFNRSLSATEIQSLYNSTAYKYLNNFTTIGDGSHSFKGYVVDGSGNVNSTETRTVTLDTTAPSLVISSPLSMGYSNGTSILFNLSSSETSSGNGFIVPNLDGSLVSWWRMDDTNSSGGLVDYMGRNNGSAVGGAVQNSSGKFGKGMSFDGVDDYINTSFSLNGLTNLTFSTWVYINSEADYKTIWSIDKSSDNCNGEGLYFSGGNTINYRIADDTDSYVLGDITNRWTNIIAVQNSTAKLLYINGILNNSFASSGATTGNVGLQIGNYNSCAEGVNFNGSIDEVTIFNKSLTSDEIQALYNATRINHQENLAEGSHNYKVYAGDTAGNIASSDVNLTVDTVYPSISYQGSTPATGSNLSSTSVVVNLSTSDNCVMMDYGTGGTVTTNGNNFVRTFTSNGTFVASQSLNAQVLVVAGGGGGGGGQYWGAGGGAGGLIYNSSYGINAGSINVVVGSGGTGGAPTGTGENGANSSFDTLIAVGGGGGGKQEVNAKNGGSGGGGGYGGNGGTGIAGQGNNGGTGGLATGGGGGAGAVGGAGGATYAGNGGNGLNYTISGSNVYYAGGGGGGIYSGSNSTGGAGGLGGGGNGTTGDGIAGTANSGGGGGGSERLGTATGGAGGSGIVIVSYPGTQVCSGQYYSLLNLDNSLVGWWRFENSTSAVDETGVNNGTLNGGVTAGAGKFGQGYQFDGSSGYVNAGNGANLNILGNITISAWVKPNSFTLPTSNPIIVGKRSSGHAYSLDLLSGGNIEFDTYGVSSSETITSSNPLSTGQWYHILGVYDGSNKYIYVNGVLVLSTVATGNILTSTSNVGIGSLNGDGASYLFNGSIDEVMIFNRSLSATEIASLYNSTANKYYNNFTLGQGQHSITGYAVDIAGNKNSTETRTFNVDTLNPTANIVYPYNNSNLNNGNNINFTANLTDANLKNATLNVNGTESNYYLNFDGVNDYVNVTDSDSLDMGTSTNPYWTISLWFKPNSLTQTQKYLIGKLNDAGNANAYAVIWEYDDNVVDFYSAGEGDDLYTGVVSDINVGDTNWHHIVYSYHPGNWSGYLDGAVQFSSNKNTNITATTGQLFFADFSSGANKNFNGSIDEVRIYNRSLSQSEITQLYNQNRISNPSLLTSGLVAWYNFNEGTGTTLIDRATGINNGTISGATWANSYTSNTNFAAGAVSTVVGVVQNLIDGVYNWWWSVWDYAGNTATTANYSLLVDSVYPTLSYVSPSPTSGGLSNSSVTLNVSVSDNNPTYSFFNDGLVGWWRFENSTSAIDETGINNGTLNGGVTASAGKFGQGYSFDRLPGSYVLSNRAVAGIGSSNITIGFWVYPLESSGWQYAISTTKFNSAFNWKVVFAGTQTFLTTSCGGAYIHGEDGFEYNKWQYMVYTISGTDNRAYLNGNLIESRAASCELSEDSNYRLLIGAYESLASTENFNGSIDEVMIFNRSLSADEIKALYNSTAYKLQRTLDTQSTGSKSYTAYVVDAGGNKNSSTLNFQVDADKPVPVFVSPTNANNTYLNASSFIVNATIIESNLRNLNYSSTTSNGYMTFDGSSGYVNTGITPSKLNVAQSHSYSFWIKSSIKGSPQSILYLGNYQAYSPNFIWDGADVSADGTSIRYVQYDGTESAISTTVNVGSWTNIIAVDDGVNINIYKNGMLQNSSVSRTPNINSAATLRIGTTQSLTDYFNGSIDEIRIYNRSLTQSEITELYQNGRASNANNVNSGLVSYYNFEEGSGTNVVDRVAGANNGTITGGAVYSGKVPGNYSLYDDSLVLMMNFDNNSAVGDSASKVVDVSRYGNNGTINGGAVWNASGKFGGAMTFDGSSGKMETSSFDSSNIFSVGLWFYSNNVPSGSDYSVFIGKTGPGVNGVFDFYNYGSICGAGKFELYFYTDTWRSFCSSSGFQANQWYYLSAVANNSVVNFYINGQLDKSHTYSNPVQSANSPIALGYSKWNANWGTNMWFNGSIDEVRIYNRSLTASEIQQLYQSNLAKYNQTQWNLYVNESGIGNGQYDYSVYANDLVGNNNVSETRRITLDSQSPVSTIIAPANNTYLNNGTYNFTLNVTDNLGIKNATLNVEHQGNYWLNFDGVDDKVSKLTPALNIGNGSFAVSMWVYPKSTAGWQIPITIGSESSNNAAYFNWDRDNEKFGFEWWGGGGGINSISTYGLNAWHHIVGVYNGTNSLLYVDGSSAAIPVSHSSSNIGNETIQISGYSGGYYFNGSMDEVRIYNRSLTADEITKIYRNALKSNVSVVDSSGLVAYYDFNEGSGSTLIDRATGINNGTITGATYSNTESTTVNFAEGTVTVVVGVVKNLLEGVYKWWWTVYDYAGLLVQTDNQTLTVDLTYPSIAFESSTPDSGAGANGEFMANASISDSYLKNITWTFNGSSYTYGSNYLLESPVNLTSGLVLLMNFDNESVYGENSTYVVDYSGLGNNGTAVGGVVINSSNGKYGMGAGFDGVNDYVNINHNSGMNPTNSLTACFWFNRGSHNEHWRELIGANPYTAGPFLIFTEESVNGELRYLTNIDNVEYRLNTNFVPSSNTWYYACYVVDPSATKHYSYINGLLSDSGNIPNGLITSSSTSTIIGYNGASFNGSMDEVSIWNRSLSASEISQLYNQGAQIKKHNVDTYYNYAPTNTLNTTMQVRSTDGLNWNVLVNQTGLGIGRTYSYLMSAADMAGNVNSTETRTIKGNTVPVLRSILLSPNDTDGLDPYVNVSVTVNITDSTNNFESAILQWKNSTGSYGENNITLSNVSGSGSGMIMNASWELPSYESNLSYRIVMTDVAETAYSTNYSILSYWDCGWTATTDLGAVAGWDQNKKIGDLIINNTGDSQYANANCSLDFRLTHSLLEGRVYYDGVYYKPSSIYTIAAKGSQNITLNATFGREVKQENLIITTSEVSLRSANGARNTTSTLVSNQNGPYLYEKITTSPSEVQLTSGNFSLNGYVRNLMGSPTPTDNNTAYNLSFYWELPSNMQNISGAVNLSYENLSDNNLNYAPLNVGFISLADMTPGVKAFYLKTKGYNLIGELIKDANNNTLLSESVNVTFQCYNESDGVYVTACGSLDGDYVAPVTTVTAPGTGGGGGGFASGGGGGGESRADYQFVRGKTNEIVIPFVNKDKNNSLKGVTFSLSGELSKYMELVTSSVSEIGPGESMDIVIRVTSPGFIKLGQQVIGLEISGSTPLGSYYEKKSIVLQVNDISKDDAFALIGNATALMEKFTNEGFNYSEVDKLVSEMKDKYDKLDYLSVKNDYAALEVIVTSALESKKIISELNDLIAQSKEKGIDVSGSERILKLAELSLRRNDYAEAYARAKEAQVTFALEVKGELATISYYLKNNKKEIGMSAFFLFVLGFAGYKGVSIRLLVAKIKKLKEEEKILHGLMKVVQRQTFTEKKMSMEEYGQAMQFYEKRLSNVVEQLIELESKRAHALRFTSNEGRLKVERDRIVSLIKEIQTEYLKRKTIETKSYELRLESYNRRLGQIDEHIATLEAKQALKGALR